MDLLDEALAWHTLGYAPLPVAPDGTKRPGLPRWKDFIDEPPTVDEIRGFHARVDTDGIGLLCGHASGDLEMLEVEGRAAHLIDELGRLLVDNEYDQLWERLQAGYVEQSPSGGIHWLYRVDGPAMPNTKLARDADRQVLVETRGEGGFTVIAPSAGRSHPTGKPWTVLRGGRDTIPTISVDERDALYAIATILDQAPPATEWEKPPANRLGNATGIRPGDDYNAKASWDDILSPLGWTKAKRLGQGWGWTRPGKRALDGISATTGTSADGEDRLYVFSTSTEFDTERPYSKFAAYTLLEQGGDYTAAARALSAAGYGTQIPEPVLTISGNAPTPASTRPELRVLQGGAGVTDGSSALAPQPEQTLRTSEDGHAHQLIAAYANMIAYCPQRSLWIAWDGCCWRWQPKGGGVVREYAKTVARAFGATDTTLVGHKRRSLSARGISGCLEQASTDSRISVDITRLDADPWVLNTPAGLVDLHTGILGPSDPAAYCTKTTTAAPDPRPETAAAWTGFIADTFGGHDDIAAYVQRLAGVTLIGTVREQLLAFLHGLGANGKSTLVEAMMHALGIGEGGYAIAAPAEMLMIRKHSEHPAELAQLAGARMVVCSELDDGQRFAEAKIKQLTGSDSINARFLYGQPFTFQPSHTFWLLGNHRPQARTGGMAFWRRVKLLEFDNVVPVDKRDPALGDKLAAAAGVILQWAINGAANYYREGIQEPSSVTKATEAYAEDQDTVGRFIADMVHLSPGISKVAVGQVRAAYEQWCIDTGESAVSAKRLGVELLERFQISQVKSNGRRFYSGLTLLRSDDDEEERDPWDAR